MAFSLDDHEPKKIRPAGLTEPTKLQKSRAQERRTAKLGGGYRQAASGAARGAKKKGDVTGVADFLIECKRTDGKGVYLSDLVISKIEQEALCVGKKPILQIDVDGRERGNKRWFLVPEGVFFDLLGEEPPESGLVGRGALGPDVGPPG